MYTIPCLRLCQYPGFIASWHQLNTICKSLASEIHCRQFMPARFSTCFVLINDKNANSKLNMHLIMLCYKIKLGTECLCFVQFMCQNNQQVSHYLSALLKLKIEISFWNLVHLFVFKPNKKNDAWRNIYIWWEH